MSASDSHDFANEADVEEQEKPLVEEPADEEATADRGVPPRRDDVDEADYQDQIEPVGPEDEDYPYDG